MSNEDVSMNDPEVWGHCGPELLGRDIALLNAFMKWLQTVRKVERYGPNWFPTYFDIVKSRLFWRIRSGKEPLKYPPPLCYSCPWYEVIELDEEHTTFEPVRVVEGDGEKWMYVSGSSRYTIIEENTMEDFEHASIVAFGPYRFHVWNGVKEFKRVSKEGSDFREVGFIRYVGCVEPPEPQKDYNLLAVCSPGHPLNTQKPPE